jgi:hypothetical protein
MVRHKVGKCGKGKGSGPQRQTGQDKGMVNNHPSLLRGHGDGKAQGWEVWERERIRSSKTDWTRQGNRQ